MESKIINGKGVVKGLVEGEAIVMAHSFSFLGDVDMSTSEIIAQGHEQYGVPIAGKILIYPETKGSSGGCIVLTTLAHIGKQPGAIINLKMADYNLVEGCILAKVPVVCCPEEDPANRIKTGDIVRVDGKAGTIEIIG